MDEIRQAIDELRDVWGRAYEKALERPEASAIMSPSMLAMVNESVATLSHWIGRSKAPTGFSPGFQAARGVVAISLPALVAQAKQIEALQFNHLSGFTANLVAALSAVHTLAVFSKREDLESAAASLSTELAQALGLVQTAQRELSQKKKLLQETEAAAERIGEIDSTTAELHTQIQKRLEAVIEAEEKTIESKEGTADAAAEVAALKEEAAALLATTKGLKTRIDEILSSATTTIQTTKQQQELIASLLPRAASAGLAAAFATRGRSLELTKWAFVGVFVVSLVILGVMAWKFPQLRLPDGMTYWQHLLYRLPMAAPLVWLAWFSAVQYGNTVRVQEDYAFKEATSKAFQGYRDHMEHLAEVDSEEGGKALNLLASKTIEILAREPLRIFDKTHEDASPASKMAGLFSGKGDPKEDAT